MHEGNTNTSVKKETDSKKIEPAADGLSSRTAHDRMLLLADVILEFRQNNFNGYGKTEAFGILMHDFFGVHANDLSICCDERTTAVAEADLGVGLD
jgi:hypothetical protein